MSKQAVVFILDANQSMLKKSADGRTRFEEAKEAITTMVSDLMIEKKTNEISIIVTKTSETQHHKIAATEDTNEDCPFPNLTELTPGITKLSFDILRRLRDIQVEKDTTGLRGDICDALILAADAHFERGLKYKFQRKIVLITDADSEVVLDVEQALHIIDSMRDMECRLQVVGIDFSQSQTFDEPLVAPSNEEPAKRIKTSDDDDGGVLEVAVKDDDEEDIPVKTESSDIKDHQENVRVYSSKPDVEELLISFTEKTGGSVDSVSSFADMVQRGKRVSRPTMYKFDFHLAPGIVFEAKQGARLRKYTSTNDLPTATKPKNKQAVLLKEGSEIIKDEDGREAVDGFTTNYLYVDEDQPDDIVEQEQIAMAVHFGSTLVPMSDYDYQGLRDAGKSSPKLEVIGYMERTKIPPAYLIGPPTYITGHDLVRSCAAISALSQSLSKSGKVAIGKFVKSSRSTGPILVAIYPFYEESHALLALQIPYENEVRKLTLNSLEIPEETKEADELIDSLLLPDESLQSGTIPLPFLRTWNQTIIQRAMDPTADLVKTRDESTHATPADVLREAEGPMRAFQEAFPVARVEDPTAAAAKKSSKKALTYTDFLEE